MARGARLSTADLLQSIPERRGHMEFYDIEGNPVEIVQNMNPVPLGSAEPDTSFTIYVGGIGLFYIDSGRALDFIGKFAQVARELEGEIDAIIARSKPPEMPQELADGHKKLWREYVALRTTPTKRNIPKALAEKDHFEIGQETAAVVKDKRGNCQLKIFLPDSGQAEPVVRQFGISEGQARKLKLRLGALERDYREGLGGIYNSILNGRPFEQYVGECRNTLHWYRDLKQELLGEKKAPMMH